jgi:hypothetical protein
MISFKVSFRNEVRRLSLEDSEDLYSSLLQSVGESFGAPKKGFVLSYVDDEGDRCVIGGSE